MLEVEGLVKSFGELRAVRGVSFQVAAGQVFGLLGPNGAGKTTTISMVCGLLAPDAGSVRVDGIELASDPRAAKQRMGVVPQDIALYQDLSARENLSFWGGIYGMRGAELAGRVDAVLDQVGLEERSREPVKNFSGGMKRRLNLAAGLLHGPKLLLLDEPTVGIDPQARHNILGVVRQVADAGTSVLYTTHYMEEAEELCDELAIMDHGQLLAQGDLASLRAEFGEGTLITVGGDFDPGRLQEFAGRAQHLRPVKVEAQRAMLMAPAGQGVGKALEELYGSGLPVADVKLKEPGLEDLFLKLTGRELRD